MKKLIPILLIVAFVSCKKEKFSTTLTKSFSIQSVSNGANYIINVALPDDYHPESRKYATVYVLDGEENFDFVAVNCKKISSELSTTNILVVSIGYGNDRSVDYTPTKATEGKGGADKFMQFIKQELIPKMESDYGADTLRKNRIILGHSFGGLAAAYAFTNYNNVFGNYIILSPSIWYDNEIILKLEKQNRALNCNNHQLVFIGLGELENMGRMLAPFEAFFQCLKNNYADIQIIHHLEPHLDHRGSENPSILKGLNFYFHNR